MAVQTVSGDIDKSMLGVTTAHEHVFIDLTNFFKPRRLKYNVDPYASVSIENLGILSRDCYALRDNLFYNDFVVQKNEMLFFKNAGGMSVADASCIGLGRDAARLKRMAAATGLNILTGTGYYVASTHPAYINERSEHDIAAEMIREIREGINVDGIAQDEVICAGFIGEIGVSEVFNDAERKVLRAAAYASVETGASIHTHINPWTTFGLEAVRILLDNGAKPERVCIDHVDVELKTDYINALLDMGVYIEFDNFGKEFYIDEQARSSGYGLFVHDTDRVKDLRRLIERGHVKQLLLSNDICLKNLLHRYGGWGYDHLLTNIVPMMKEFDITVGSISKMLIDNPAAFFDIP
ncbi:aryldialkylphosphatase [Clostridia bacterium]|nr:aryldialkylphosphatase [Clostridia bacterium]